MVCLDCLSASIVTLISVFVKGVFFPAPARRQRPALEQNASRPVWGTGKTLAQAKRVCYDSVDDEPNDQTNLLS